MNRPNPDPAHILIVDDTQKNIQVLGTMLRDAGYRINVATDGKQALDATARVAPDLILLDIIMPEMDGFETCRRLKQDSETADIPVIFLTAKVEPEDIVRGFELGAVDYVTKPFNAAELLKRVDTHLTIKRLRERLEQNVRQLESALDDVRRLQREQEAFVRHELSNTMGPVVGFIDMALSETGDVLADKHRTWLQRARDSAAQMNRMLRGLKRLQDLERGRADLDLRRIDLVELMKDTARTVLAGDLAGVSLELDAPESCTVQADGSLLPGVFTNLVKNAAEHVADLGDAEARRVSVSIRKEEDEVVVSVQNGGEPIPEDRLATFFDKFNSSKPGSGTGLGTTYAALVTRAHGGRISVTSSSEDGTTVTTRLPVSPPVNPAQNPT